MKRILNSLCCILQGIGIEETLEEIVRRIPAPHDTADKPLRALIFDSHYDSYKVQTSWCSETAVTIAQHAELCHDL